MERNQCQIEPGGAVQQICTGERGLGVVLLLTWGQDRALELGAGCVSSGERQRTSCLVWREASESHALGQRQRQRNRRECLKSQMGERAVRTQDAT